MTGRQQVPVQGQLALSLARAVQDKGGAMSAAGRWRWRITGPDGTLIVKSRATWPHRALRAKIREHTGIALPGQEDSG